MTETDDAVGEWYDLQKKQRMETETVFQEWIKPLTEKGYVELVTLRQAFDAGFWQGKLTAVNERVAELQPQPIKVFDEDNNEITECYCDPCGDENCDCRGKRCDYCLANN